MEKKNSNDDAMLKAKFLQTCFPDMDIEYLSMELSEASGDVDKAMDMILSRISINEEFEKVDLQRENDLIERNQGIARKDESLATLISIFEDLDGAFLNETLKKCDFSVEKTIDYISTKLNNGDLHQKKKSQRSFKKQIIPIIPEASKKAQSSDMEDDKRILDVSGTGNMRKSNLSAALLQEKAASYFEKRNTQFHKASTAYKRGGPYGGAIAAYYADVGQHLNQKAHETKLQAAKQIVLENRDQKFPLEHPRWVVDLHNVSVKEAITIVEEELYSWYDSEYKGMKHQINIY